MLEHRLVRRDELSAALDMIRPDLIRYPALDAEAFERRVKEFLDDG